MATSFQLAQPVYQTSNEALQDAFSRTWMHWAGPPQELVLDGESALCSEAFRNFTQRHSINTRVVAAYAHWQMGKVERHGGILQGMLDKFHHENTIQSPQQFEEALHQCCRCKKRTIPGQRGYTPEILVLGKSVRTPGSVVSEPYDASQYLLINPQAESSDFFQQLKKRESARRAFIEIDNDQAMRRAVLRRVRPHRGHHASGTHVMYWRQNQWRGPGRVIHQEDQHVVWISHLGKIFLGRSRTRKTTFRKRDSTILENGSRSQSTTDATKEWTWGIPVWRFDFPSKYTSNTRKCNHTGTWTDFTGQHHSNTYHNGQWTKWFESDTRTTRCWARPQ